VSPVLSAETWAILAGGIATAALTVGIRLLWRRRKDLEDL
jgi:LPXTG-motif cell wall-anchored protein